MSAKTQLRFIVTVLLVVGLGITAFKHFHLGFPMWPGAKETVWTAEAKITFVANGDPVRVSMALPHSTNDLFVLDQGAAGRGFGYHVENEEFGRRGIWEARAPVGEQSVFYRARIYKGGGRPEVFTGFQEPVTPDKPVFAEAEADAADTLLAEAYAYSSNAEGMAIRLSKALTASDLSPAAEALIGEDASRHKQVSMILKLLHAAEVPAQRVRGIYLDDEEGRTSRMEQLFAVWNGETWRVISPETSIVGLPENFLPWQTRPGGLFEVEGAEDSEIHFAVIADEIAARRAALDYGEERGAYLIDFSIFSLPVETQKTFATLLLIPIGALVVVVLRNLVGLQTSGTFMPILIALVFVQTQLLTGLVLFVVVVGIGLIIRGYLTSLNLLLVPRIASVLIVVISLYIFLSVIGYKLGFTKALSVTFFPMIIISWTIERMSVLAEEEGIKDVLIQGGGSLLTAVIAYMFMTNRYIAYWVFEFPELLLVVLAIILIIGQYTGYRLSELRRFEPLARND